MGTCCLRDVSKELERNAVEVAEVAVNRRIFIIICGGGEHGRGGGEMRRRQRQRRRRRSNRRGSRVQSLPHFIAFVPPQV
jgi:hypothetical protein